MAEKISLADEISADVDKLYAKLGDRTVTIPTKGLTESEKAALTAKLNGEVKGDHVVLRDGEGGKRILARGSGEWGMNDAGWRDVVERAKTSPDYISSSTGGVTHTNDPIKGKVVVLNNGEGTGLLDKPQPVASEGPLKSIEVGPLERTPAPATVEKTGGGTGTMQGRIKSMLGDLVTGQTSGGEPVQPVQRDAGVATTSPPVETGAGAAPAAPLPNPGNQTIEQMLEANRQLHANDKPLFTPTPMTTETGDMGDQTGMPIPVQQPATPAAPAAPALSDQQRQDNTAAIMNPPPQAPRLPPQLAALMMGGAGGGGGGGPGFNYGAEQTKALAEGRKAFLENAEVERRSMLDQAEKSTQALAQAQGYQAARLKADEEMQLSFKSHTDKINQLNNLMADAANQQIDPGRYWANKTGGQKAAALIAGACFGFAGQGMNWLQRIDGLVSEDMKMQAMDRQAKMEGLGKQIDSENNLYGQARQMGLDHIGALKAAEASTWMNLAEQAKIIALNAGSAMAKNNALLAYQAINQKAIEKRGEYDNHARAVAVQEGHLALQRQMMGMKLAMLGMHPAYDKATAEEIDKLRDGLRAVGALKSKLNSGFGGWGSWGTAMIPGSDSANQWGGVREDMRAIDNALYGTAGNTSPEHTRILNETAGKDWRESGKAKAWAEEREQRLMRKLQDVMMRVQNPMGFSGSAGTPTGDLLVGEEAAE